MRTIWDCDELYSSPRTYEAQGYKAEGLKAIFYDALPYQGKPTRVFAWYGFPKPQGDETFPAIVCVHGGGGTAYEEWVRKWVSRGYAAISMDLEGQLPLESDPISKRRPQHQWHGPNRKGAFADINEPVEDQWMFHAVADVILAHSLIRSFPEVDSERVGLTGISWGGIVISNVVGIDHRFRFAAPVYGCGYLHESGTSFQRGYESMSEENALKCRTLWDGSSYLPDATLPMLWINGTNDQNFYLPPWQKSYRAANGSRTICLKLEMGHSHPAGWESPEIYAFADSIVRNGEALAKITDIGCDETDAWIDYSCEVAIAKAEFIYTTDSDIKWHNRRWISIPACLDKSGQKASARIPTHATAYYFNLMDVRGLIVSSQHVEIGRSH